MKLLLMDGPLDGEVVQLGRDQEPPPIYFGRKLRDVPAEIAPGEEIPTVLLPGEHHYRRLNVQLPPDLASRWALYQ